MWWSTTTGSWWPGFVLMGVFMLVCVLAMARMMGLTRGGGMCGFWRRRPHDGADAAGPRIDRGPARGEADPAE